MTSYNLNKAATQDLYKISEDLEIPPSEVFRKLLLLMKLYSLVKAKGGCFLIRDEGVIRELII